MANAERAPIIVRSDRPVSIIQDANGTYRCLHCGLGHTNVKGARLHIIRDHPSAEPLRVVALYPPA